MFKIGLHYAFRNILRTPLRSFFTIFSIAMVISLYTLLTAVANSFTGQIQSVIHQEGIDVIIQSKFSATPLSSSIPSSTVQNILSEFPIQSHIAVVVGRKRLADRSMIFLFGLSDFSQVAGKLGLSLTQGRLYHPNSQEILISERLLRAKRLTIGETLILPESQAYKIVGTYHSWISFFNNSIICDLNHARVLLDKKEKTNMLFLSLQHPQDISTVIERINQRYPSLMAVRSSDFSDTLGSIKSLFYLSDIISVITLIIASAILINTFLIAVSERTKEIGILNAIGWRPSMIVSIFIYEALFLALIGGVLGFISSWGMMLYLKVHYIEISMFLPNSVDMALFAYSMLMSLLIAMISAIFPALHASKITIAKALKDG